MLFLEANNSLPSPTLMISKKEQSLITATPKEQNFAMSSTLKIALRLKMVNLKLCSSMGKSKYLALKLSKLMNLNLKKLGKR